MFSEKDMADLAFNGLHSYLQENIDGHTFITLSQLQQKALAQESRSKESKDNFMLLNFVGLPRQNLMLVTLSSRFTKIA
jgi:hypothetical protein